MSSQVYLVQFTCDKCGTKAEIKMHWSHTLDAELYRYTAPAGWIMVAVVEPHWDHAKRHYCPECNKPVLAELGIKMGAELQSEGDNK